MTSPSTPSTEPDLVDSKPVVSVLVLVYNHGQYLREALESVTRQQFKGEVEVLVGDDASTDDSASIAGDFAAAFPGMLHVFTHSSNIGMHANHAFLIGRARGKYIAYCEGDDYWLGSDKLQLQVDLMENHPDCGLVHSNYLHLIQLGKDWMVRPAFRSARDLENRSGWIYPAMLGANRIQTCTLLCRASLIREYRQSGPGVDAYGVADWPQTLYISHERAIHFIDRPLAAYRRTPGSATNSGAGKRVEFGLDAIRMVGDFCDFFSDQEGVRIAALSTQYRTLLWLAFMADDRKNFERAWMWLTQNQPSLLRGIYPSGMRLLLLYPRLHRAWVHMLGRIELLKHRIEFHRRETCP